MARRLVEDFASLGERDRAAAMRTNPNGQTPLHLALDTTDAKFAELCKSFIDHVDDDVLAYAPSLDQSFVSLPTPLLCSRFL